MKHILQQLLTSLLALSLIFGPATPALSLIAAGDTIDTHKLAEPPFLSLGITPNLLMLLDNSGSMLDLAYIKEEGDNATQCFDDSYLQTYDIGSASWSANTTLEYAGYFKQDSWYQWNDIDASTIPGFISDGWEFGEVYNPGDIVTVEGTLWKASDNGTATGAHITEDRGVRWVPIATDDSSANITIKNNMYYNSSNATIEGYFNNIGDSRPDGNCTSADSTDGGQHDDVCISIVSGELTYFAAKGNFLNWLTSSKFDIQKDILTGGKYDLDAQRLILENRGCAGSSFLKEVTLDNTKHLTLSVEGPTDGLELVGTVDLASNNLDQTTRIAVLGVTADGYSTQNAQCQEAIRLLELGVKNQSLSDAIAGCLDLASSNGQPAYTHSLLECWQLNKQEIPVASDINANEVEQDCRGYYNSGVYPWEITTSDSEYICFGEYDDNASKLGGYVGRCWEEWLLDSSTCIQVPCSELSLNNGEETEYPVGSKVGYSCVSSYLKLCDGNYNNSNCPGSKWITFYTEGGSITDDTCIPSPSDIGSSANCDGTPGNASYECWDDANQTTCLQNAIWDYCQGLKIPEVIDPSDLASETEELWNLPGSLIDSGKVSKFGDHPLAVMKGYIDQPSAPEGILHRTASELRMGVMAFNYVGAASECSTDPSAVLQKFCPDNDQDGAKILPNAEIKLGSEVSGSQTHLDDLVEAINDVQATSWTPLAEAMYNAIGYFTQNDELRCNSTDFQVSAADDPITNWCQDNHILIITEGASTADSNSAVVNFASDDNVTATRNGVSMNGYYDDSTDRTCTDGLEGSSYLDDLTFFGNNATAIDLYPAGTHQLPTPELDEFGNPIMIDKRGITTHIVVSGTLRDNGAGDECSPDELINNAATNGGTELMVSADPAELEANLLSVLQALRQRASAGSAASVISAARGGEGAIYQAIFWPELNRTDAFNQEYTVNWAGDVHSLFVDAAGNLYEDSNGNRTLDSNGDDNRVVIFYDEDAGLSKGRVYDGDNATYTDKVLEEIKFVWSAGEWLASLDADAGETEFNRSTIDSYISNTPARQIFTWNDLDNDGTVDYTSNAATNEVIDFVEGSFGSGDIDTDATKTVAATRGKVGYDFIKRDSGAETYEDNVNNIIGWIRGKDDNGTMRSRLMVDPDDNTNTTTWRLGDIIHSTPMVVSAPAEGYHLIYSDLSFADFYNKYQKRRQVVYFGANDGMLHAVNGGFFSSADNKFYLGDNGTALTDTPPAGETYPALGSELWAYIPYNILPHLSSLTKPEYGNRHKYYVDLRPRIFDAKIFTEEGECRDGLNNPTFSNPLCYHPHGWGTILVGGMRLGGAPIDAAVDMGQPSSVWPFYDNRQFISSYFILDITNPEKPPVLLGETTQTLTDTAFDGDLIPDAPVYVDLGYSTAISTMIIMKTFGSTPATRSNQVTNDWYLVLGSGPHGDDAMKWVSDQNAKVATINLTSINTTATSGTSDLIDSTNYPTKSLRIQKDAPSSGAASNHNKLNGTFELTDSPNGIVSDLITIDYDINPSVYNYKADVVYFGTIEGDFNAAETAWDGNGTFYRLVSRELLGLDEHSTYGTGSTTPPDTYPYDWKIKPVIDLPGQPVSGAASVGTDGHNFWLYFGTGRFGDASDKSDNATQSFYGIKEPMKWQSTNTATFSWGKLPPLSDPVVVDDTKDPGEKGLLRVDKIGVTYPQVSSTSPLFCRDWVAGAWENVTASSGDTSCLPAPLIDGAGNPKVFNYLIDYTSGDNATDFDNHYCNAAQGYKSCVDGWYKNFQPEGNRERNLGQATLFGGLLTYTTYQPFEDECQAEGLAYLYANYYQTGTAWYRPVFGYDQYSTEEGVFEKLVLGRGLALTPNLHTGSESGDPKVFIQTSTGEIRELTQTNLPHSQKEGRFKWKEGCN